MTTQPLHLESDPATGRPLWHSLPVPWIVRWSGEVIDEELPVHSAILDGQMHIALDNPTRNPFGLRAGFAAQRDELGLLWHRDRNAPGSGEPQFASLHAARVRACTLEGRCQVCGKPFGDAPVTWLESKSMQEADNGTIRYDRSGSTFTTLTAPTCPPCAEIAVRKCPANRNRAERVLVTAHTYHSCGVLADVYGYKRGVLELEKAAVKLGLDDPVITRAIVKQLMVEITDYTEEPMS